MDANAEQSRSPEAEMERRVLKVRARELARESVKAAEVADTVEVIEFELAGESYGIRLDRVLQVCPLDEITPVPCTPPFVVGVVNIRGEILTVLDLRKFFDLPSQGITQLNRLILIEDGRMKAGILADGIRGVRAVPLAGLQASLPTLSGVRADYLVGITPDHVAILDAVKILSDERIIVYEEVEP